MRQDRSGSWSFEPSSYPRPHGRLSLSGTTPAPALAWPSGLATYSAGLPDRANGCLDRVIRKPNRVGPASDAALLLP